MAQTCSPEVYFSQHSLPQVYPPEVMEDVNTTVLSKMDNILIEVHIKLKDGENWTSTMIKVCQLAISLGLIGCQLG